MTDFTSPRRRLLCVDAHADSRAWLQGVLGDYDLMFAATGFEALRQINRQSFDGFVLDFWLPDLSGTDLCRDIRKLDPHAPIVFCSTASSLQEQQHALRAGANAYLCKPCDEEALRSKLHALLAAADIESLRAKVAAHAAIHEELERRRERVVQRSDAARALAASSVERTARAKAYAAFINAGGTRGQFDSWWQETFHSAQADDRGHGAEPGHSGDSARDKDDSSHEGND